MGISIEERILQSIKHDDIKAFNAVAQSSRCETFRLGRFPLLSLMYLYNSRKLLSEYEDRLLQISVFEELREPFEISKRFRVKAGKCLRLYLNGEIVSPLEMLLILNKTKRLKNVYPSVKPTSAVKTRLKSIYSIRYALGIKFEGDEIIIDKRPLNRREKRNIAALCMSLIVALTIIISVPVATVSLIPKPVEGEVTAFDQIDFSSKKVYTLKNDIVVPENYTLERVNCTINGAGRKLTVGKGAMLGELNGQIYDLTMDTYGTVVFKSVSLGAIIRNVTVNVNTDIAVSEGGAFVALTNYGSIENLTLNASGSIKAVATSGVSSQEFYFGGIVHNNSYTFYASNQTIYVGVIKNCEVNYDKFTLSGETKANAAFGGVAGKNGGYVQDCKVVGEITADTFDVAGVCADNERLLSGNVNEADLFQTSADTEWNPIVCGIVMTNSYAVENCVNKGTLTAVSTCGQFELQENIEPTVSAAGIAYYNTGSEQTPYLKNCVNYGKVSGYAEYRNTYSAGICIASSGAIESCINRGAVTVESDNGCSANSGGIAAQAYGYIYKSINEGSVSASGDGTSYIGGIAAYSRAQFLTCLSRGDVTVSAKEVYAGGIFGFGDVIANSASYIFGGTADYCISECKLEVTSASGNTSYVGGIAGYVSETAITVNDTVVYRGGRIINSYFTGECNSDVTYFGNIAGVCGANIYEINSYTSGISIYYNFKDNFYIENSFKAFGAKKSADGEFEIAADKGASPSTLENIKKSDGYKSILSDLEK